jgi:hypothetical protein
MQDSWHGMAIRSLTLLALLLTACANEDAADPRGKRPGWPSLAPRPNEVSLLVPRVPLDSSLGGSSVGGRCVGCGPDAPAQPPPLPPLAGLPAIVEQAVPADAEARLAAIEREIANLESEWPVLQRDARRAVAAAGSEARRIESEAQASRFEALFQPLGVQDAGLTALENQLADASDGAMLAARAAGLRSRVDALDAVRRAGL